MSMTCPSCKRDFTPELHPGGRCESVDRGRRFFLMGALALPVAQKLKLPELVAPMGQAIEGGMAAGLLYSTRTFAWHVAVSEAAMIVRYKEMPRDLPPVMPSVPSKWFAT